jgi:pathogenesis-related protein 1
MTALLNAHNDWRQRYSVPSLVWDDTVAGVAQDWANQMAASGNFSHRPNNQYGENIWSGTTGFFVPLDIVNSWGDEVQDYAGSHS